MAGSWTDGYCASIISILIEACWLNRAFRFNSVAHLPGSCPAKACGHSLTHIPMPPLPPRTIYSNCGNIWRQQTFNNVAEFIEELGSRKSEHGKFFEKTLKYYKNILKILRADMTNLSVSWTHYWFNIVIYNFLQN